MWAEVPIPETVLSRFSAVGFWRSILVLSEYSKLRILCLWREGEGPTAIVEILEKERVTSTRKMFLCSFPGTVCTFSNDF